MALTDLTVHSMRSNKPLSVENGPDEEPVAVMGIVVASVNQADLLLPS